MELSGLVDDGENFHSLDRCQFQFAELSVCWTLHQS